MPKDLDAEEVNKALNEVNKALNDQISKDGFLHLNAKPIDNDIITELFDATFPDAAKFMVVTGHGSSSYIGAITKAVNFIYFKLENGEIIIEAPLADKIYNKTPTLFHGELSNPNIIEDIKEARKKWEAER